jgi:hypothetical protein
VGKTSGREAFYTGREVVNLYQWAPASVDYIGSFSVPNWLIHFDSSENRNVFNMNLTLPLTLSLCDDVSCADDASTINHPIEA